MAVYATYDFYQNTFMGTAIASETDFDRWALEASAEIDLLTFDRAAAIVDAEEDADKIGRIGMATCAVAEQLQALAQTGGAVQFEMVGRHSVSYARPLSEAARVRMAARRYLASTGLMYRGFFDGEYGC